MQTSQETSFLSDLAEAERNPVGPQWLAAIRREAARRFAETGFPTRKNEEWRFTPIAPIAETPFAPAPQAELGENALRPYLYADIDAARVVLLNGRYAPELSQMGSLPRGVVVKSLAQAIEAGDASVERHLSRYAAFETQPFAAINTALFSDGVLVEIPANAVVERAIHIVSMTSAKGEAVAAHPRALILAGENSRATIIETYGGASGETYLANAVTEIALAQDALVDHYKVQQESLAAYHVATMAVKLARNANFSSHSVTFGGAITRNDINAALTDQGCECTLNGLYTGRGRQLVDNHTFIDHAMPHCNSHELYKGVLDDHSRGVFNGKILVRQDAQKTDAKQTNQVLLLSDDAQINTKPQLEIYADDVRCTHGATVGQASDEALFYLRSRGIPKDEARNLLIYAFASDVISRMKVEPLRDRLNAVLLAERVSGGGGRASG